MQSKYGDNTSTRRCSVCARPIQDNATRNERELHEWQHELEHAVDQRRITYASYRRAERQRNHAEAISELDDNKHWTNEVNRCAYYIALLESLIDQERSLH